MRRSIFLSDKQPPSGLLLSCSPDPCQRGAAESSELVPSVRFFGLNQTSGELSIREGVPPGSYHLQVRVSDPTWPDVTSTAQVDVRELQRDALKNAASVRLSSESRRQRWTSVVAGPFLISGSLSRCDLGPVLQHRSSSEESVRPFWGSAGSASADAA